MNNVYLLYSMVLLVLSFWEEAQNGVSEQENGMQRRLRNIYSSG